MTRIKKMLLYLLLVVLLAAFGWEMGGLLIRDCVSVLRDGVGTADYFHVSQGDDDTIYALSLDADGALLVVRGNEQGERLSRLEIPGELLPKNWHLFDFYPASADTFYLSLYALDEAGAMESLQLYRLHTDTMQMDLLLERSGSGATSAEKMDSVRLSSMSKQNGVVTFALLENGEATIYRAMDDASGLTMGETITCGQAQNACVLSDGRLVILRGSELILSDSRQSYSGEGQLLTELRQSGAGLFALDGAGLEVFYMELTSPDRRQPVVSLENNEYDISGAADLAITSDGEVLLMMEDGRLLLDRGNTVLDLSSILYRTAGQSVLILAGLALGVLALAFVLWLICLWRDFRISLLVRWGVLILAVAILGVNAALDELVLPRMEKDAAARAYDLAGSVTELMMDGSCPDGLNRQIEAGISSAGSGSTLDTEVTVFEKDESGAWRVVQGGQSYPAGARGELTDVFDARIALNAVSEGTASCRVSLDGRTNFCFYRSVGGYLAVVRIGGERLMAQTESGFRDITGGVWIVTALLLVLALLALAQIAIALHKVEKGLECLNTGGAGVRIRIRTGDELESVGQCVNTLAQTMRGMEDRQDALTRSYRRFLPERLVTLLEQESLASVDKHTFKSRRMATMMVRFQFPPQVYEKGGQQLFDHLNEIIERTSPIIAKNDGTVFNFSYNGYDAMFDGEPKLAVSTAVAVQQEILAVNKERELDGRPKVKLRIALDVGDVLMGVVGDEHQIVPTAVSSSFSVTRRLIELCDELDANILCTEELISEAAGYGSRYMGQYVDGGKVIRVNEIFDGDTFEVRRVKEKTAKRFSEAVYLLYSRDFSGAKRIFLDLVHHNVGDGGARYYLYLAHELEKDQEQEISLDYRL